MTIALISNVTINSAAMRINSLTKEDVYCPKGHNTWMQEISDPGSNLYASGADMIFVALHGAPLIGDALDEHTCKALLDPIASTIGESAAAHGKITFVVSTIDIPATEIKPLVSRSAQADAAAYWRTALEDLSLPILDLAEMISDMGRKNFYNKRVWYMGGMPYSKAGEEAIASEIDVIWKAAHGTRKKCLALDLDNTLWGGAIGELGIDGLHLDRVGSGSRFRDFQNKILELKNSGVSLVILSKNNMIDALNGIDNHPGMALRSGDFAAIVANWGSKSQNLKAVAQSLNIGTDSFVFIDDNPLEREMMKLDLPEVAVPEFPDDSSNLEEFILDVAHRYFLRIKTEDKETPRAGIAGIARQ
ncbi:MAG: HAD-IIIC family phosphatase [Synergistaceae bacterium]|jgi:HAD superfamily phosphatase (TIGR01681 family)|nr:HAD-IIIC family phosphatase [Synergistaceae bacterium]